MNNGTVIRDSIFYNFDCIEGMRQYIKDNSVDLIITDPPYGINGDKLHKHYNRKEEYVIDGYIEIPQNNYESFTNSWINEASRILKPNGQIYIVSGYTNLYLIIKALHSANLKEINHIIWKYNFGVYTKRKYISSHYHILYYEKPGKGRRKFNLESRYGVLETNQRGRSLNYQDREDVWIINREYKPGQKKNKNELPSEILMKMIQYSSGEGDLVCDLFLGGFSTAKIAVGMNRKFIGFELSTKIFNEKIGEMQSIIPGGMLDNIRIPKTGNYINQGKSWTKDEIESLYNRYNQLYSEHLNKKIIIENLMNEFGRGRWAIQKLLDKKEIEIDEKYPDITQYP